MTSNTNIPKYIRASEKQLHYLDMLCEQLGIVKRHRYMYFSMIMANKEITKLQKRIAKNRLPVQLELIN